MFCAKGRISARKGLVYGMGMGVEAKVFLIYAAAIAVMFLLGKLLVRLVVNGVIGAAFIAVLIDLFAEIV